MGQPEHIAAIIKSIIKNTEEKKKDIILELNDSWEEIVGESIARHTKALRVDKKTLIILTDSSVWLQELRMRHSKKIVSKLQTLYHKGTIEKVRFTIGTV